MHLTETTNMRFVLAAVLLSLVVAFAAVCVVPLSAFGLDVVKCTAKPNADSGSDVMGASVTRITWEGQADADESVTALSITLPEHTTFSIDDARVTMLTGPSLMERTKIEADFTIEGQTVNAVFAEPALEGGYFRIELYDVVFPAEGGFMQLFGSYTLADDSRHDMEEIPTITVVGVTPVEQLAQYLEQQEWVQQWNSNTFLRLFLNPPLLVTSFPIVFSGFLMALGIVAVAFPVAIPFGLILALMRMARFRVLRGIATTYVNVVRGTPLFLQIYIAFFGLPLANIVIPPFPLGVLVLAMNSSAYLCEIFRAGIQSISKGQFEAARSLGMNGARTMLFVIIPQTVQRVIPTMTSEFILLYKDTSMLAAVGIMEVVMYAKTIVASTGSITPYIVAACFYLVITLPLAKLVGKLEMRLSGNDSGRGKKRKRKKSGVGGSADGTSVGLTSSIGATASDAYCPPGTIAARLDEPENVGITPEQMSSL